MTVMRIANSSLQVACLTVLAGVVSGAGLHLQAQDPLPSWNEGPVKTSIVLFVDRVTTPGSPGFVPVEERVAVFDNDGTLWSEQPLYFQLQFAIDRVHELAGEHPEWKDQQPFRSVLENDRAALAATGKQGILQLVMATHADMTTDEFAESVDQWIRTARHPTLNRPYTELVYQPMLELLEYLREKEFRTWIVSGGGVEFMRVWAPRVYGIPPEQIIGSTIKTELQMRNGEPVLVRQPEIDFIDDEAGKPVGINRFIGRRPVAAFGNSDGDLQMLQWTTSGHGERFALVVRHTDGEREWSYDRESHIGRLDQALDAALAKGWTIVDMQRDWKVIYPFKKAATQDR